MVLPQKIQGWNWSFLGERLVKGIITARRAGGASGGVELMLDIEIPPRSQKSENGGQMTNTTATNKSGCPLEVHRNFRGSLKTPSK
jgi:hypothetical protein